MKAPRLLELQRTLHQVFRDALTVEAAAAALGSDPRRLGLYHRAVHVHVRQALEANMPVTLASLPADTRQALHAAYFAAKPAPNWSLDAAAEGFPDFLDAQLLAGGRPGLTAFHPALARLEWELTLAWTSESALPEPASLTAMVLNPTLAVLESHFPLVVYLSSPDAAGPRALPAALDSPELVLIFRHPERQSACYHSATDDLLFALKVAHDGLDPADAARAAGLDASSALAAVRAAVEIGLVLAPPGLYR